jgi:hypothetical protein
LEFCQTHPESWKEEVLGGRWARRKKKDRRERRRVNQRDSIGEVRVCPVGKQSVEW